MNTKQYVLFSTCFVSAPGDEGGHSALSDPSSDPFRPGRLCQVWAGVAGQRASRRARPRPRRARAPGGGRARAPPPCAPPPQTRLSVSHGPPASRQRRGRVSGAGAERCARTPSRRRPAEGLGARSSPDGLSVSAAAATAGRALPALPGPPPPPPLWRRPAPRRPAPRPAVTCPPAPRLPGRARLLAGHRRGHPEAAGTEAERRCRPRLRQRQPCAERRPDGGGGGDGRAGERPERRPQPRRRPARGGQAAGQRREGRLLRGAPDVPDPLLQVGAAPRPPPSRALRPAAAPGAPPPAAPHWPRRAAPRRHWPAPLPVAWAVGAGGGEAAGGGLQPGEPRRGPSPAPAAPAGARARGLRRPTRSPARDWTPTPTPDPEPRPGPRLGPKPWPRVQTARVPEPPRPLAPSPALSAVESESLAPRPPVLLPPRPAARL